MIEYENLRKSNDSGGPDGYSTFPLRVIHEVRLRVGPTVPIVVKFNVDDGFAGGLKFDQHVLKFVRELVSSGDVDLLVPSCGYVDQNGFHMLRGTVPYWNMFINMPNWIDDREGEGLCTSLLSIAFADEWKKLTGHGNRARWLREKYDMLYDKSRDLVKI